MLDYCVYCLKCGYEKKDELAYRCPKCGGIYDVKYSVDASVKLKDVSKPGIFKYHALLPVLEKMEYISLGESGTALIKSIGAGLKIGIPRLFFKNETVNPSGSFKDRALALAVSRAKMLNRRAIVVASAGNGSASACTYAARAGMRAVVVVPESAPAAKIGQALTLGAKVFKVPGNFSNSFMISRELAKKYEFYNVTTTFVNPYAREGYKTVAYELYEQMEEMPDWIAIPIGAGPLLAGMLKGFEDLRLLGLNEKIPRFICVQTERSAPISTAFLKGMPVKEWPSGQTTIASGINDSLIGYTDEGDYTIDCIKKSAGTAVVVSEEELSQSVAMLASMEGIYAEPAGAVGLYGVKRLAEEGIISPNDRVLVMVTGHGLKNPIATTCEVQIVMTSEQLMGYL